MQLEMLLFGLASKLGLHLVTMAHLANIVTSFPKKVSLGTNGWR
jgi:hypothetical protein